jgi:hypothetical protein
VTIGCEGICEEFSLFCCENYSPDTFINAIQGRDIPISLSFEKKDL